MNKKIGILGGMGSQAGLNFCQLLISKTEEIIENARNEDFPYFLLANIPVKDLIESKQDMLETVSQVNGEALLLEKAGSSFIVMSCNTMHLFLNDLKKDLTVPFLSMIDLVVEKAVMQGINSVGIIGSTTTMTSHLYEKPLREKGIESIIPMDSEHDKISGIIQRIIGGKLFQEDRIYMINTCQNMLDRGAEAIIFGCTELPLLLKQEDTNIPLFSSIDILAERIIDDYYHQS